MVSDCALSPILPVPGTAPAPNETWLPAGEVTLGVDPESAEGRLVLERFFLDGRAHGRVTLTFSGGRLLTAEPDSDLSRLRELAASALPMSERLTGLMFGINPDVTDERIRAFMGAGVVSLTMGSNLVLGGDIDLSYGPIWLTLSGSTIHVDGILGGRRRCAEAVTGRGATSPPQPRPAGRSGSESSGPKHRQSQRSPSATATRGLKRPTSPPSAVYPRSRPRGAVMTYLGRKRCPAGRPTRPRGCNARRSSRWGGSACFFRAIWPQPVGLRRIRPRSLLR